MVTMRERRVPKVQVPSDITELAASWDRSLRAEAKSMMTRRGYLQAVNQLDGFLERNGMPREPANLKREHIEAFVIDLVERLSPSTGATRFRALWQFFKWLEAEGEIRTHPMRNMKEPKPQEAPVPVLRPDDLRRLLKACDGPGFNERRDLAIILLLMDTGIRRSECANLLLADLDLGQPLGRGDPRDINSQTVTVLGKGNRIRRVRFGDRTTAAIDKYVRLARRSHPCASDPHLWLGRKGALSDQAMYEAVKRRAAMAGIPEAYVHQLRHTWAHNWLAEGKNEGSLMRLAGWRSRTMLNRYGGSAADERALEEAGRGGSLGDRL